MARLVHKLLLAVLPIGLPILTFAGFALVPTPWVGIVCAGVTIVYLLLTGAGLGQDRLPRALVVAALFGYTTGSGLGVPAVIAGLLLIGLIAGEPKLLTALTAGRLDTVRLQVSRVPWDGVLNPRSAYLTITVLTVGYLLTAAVTSTAWPIAGLVIAVTAVFGVGTVASWRWRRRRAHAPDSSVAAAVAAYGPKFAIHFAAPAGSQYQLSMWLPQFDALDDRYVLILRDKAFLPYFVDATTAPIVVAPGVSDLESVLVSSIKSVFYVNQSMFNSQCVRFAHLTHVQLMHGDSDKPASYNPISAMYDQIFVAGQAGIDRYHNHGIDIPAKRFRIVGHPQAAAIDVRETPRDGARGPVVLYAPTWTGFSSDVNFCSLPIGARICQALIDRGATIIVRPHPYTRRNPAAARQLDAIERVLAVDAEASGRAHQYGRATSTDVSLNDCINAADVLICDVSGVASDWLYSQKPFAVTDMTNLNEKLVEELPLARAAYQIASDASNMDEVCVELFDSDSLSAERHRMKRYYMGEFDVDYADAWARAARATYQ